MSSFSSITRARYVHKATRNRSHVATTTGFFSVNFLFLFHRLKNCSILQLLTLTSVWHWNYPIIGFTFLFFILWEILHIFHTFFFELLLFFIFWIFPLKILIFFSFFTFHSKFSFIFFPSLSNIFYCRYRVRKKIRPCSARFKNQLILLRTIQK